MRIALLALSVAVASAANKRVEPAHYAIERARRLAAEEANAVAAPIDCSVLPGTWTGYFPQPLNDAYALEWRGAGYPQGAFTAVFVSAGPSWDIGFGQLSPDNTTVTIALDSLSVTLTGTVSADCQTISWDNNSTWKRTWAAPKRVHLVSMNHLDVGYNGIPVTGLINNVLNEYFTIYFPRAVAMAAAMRALNYTDRFVYTTHSWLVDLYLHCPTNFTLSGVQLICPSVGDVLSFKAAVAAGDITFHAAPFNIQYGGALSQTMLDAIFAQPARVASELGVPAPRVASLRDVPGAPRSIIPALVKAGIPALTIGVNNYAPSPRLCPAPAPANGPCIWQEPSTKDSILVMLTDQNIGYPLNPGPDPLHPGGMAPSICVQHPASDAILCWAFRTDNSGPPQSIAEILSYFDIARWNFPGAQVIGSTYDAWYEEFQPALSQLPVTTQEMGETWLTGFASDPPKNAFYRVAAREYASCLAAGQCDPTNDTRLQQFLLFLMKMPEHTWGLPSIYDDANYTNAAFHAARAAGESTYVNSELSWTEQRFMGTQYAMAALADHPLAAQITAAAASLVPSLPNPAGQGFVTVNAGSAVSVSVSGGNVKLGFDASSGAINNLVWPDGTVVADATHWIGDLVYQTVNDTSIDSQHITVDNAGCCCCYGWNNMQAAANPIESRTTASLVALYANQAGPSYTAPVTFLARLSLPSLFNVQYGAPGDIWVNYTVLTTGEVALEVQLFNKTSTRLGEAIYLNFATPSSGDKAWYASVLDYYVDPLDVVTRGSQRQHGVGEGVAFVSPSTGAGIAIDTVDAPVFSPWTAVNTTSTLIVPFEPLQGPVEGFAAVLFANIYNTNFALYSIDEAFKFRFGVRPVAANAGRAAALMAAASTATRAAVAAATGTA